MPVTNVTKDLETRTITIEAEFAAPVQRVWDLYADPRQLEQVWGPPTYPATFVDHHLEPGGRVNYYMTSPEGEKYYGYWDVQSVDEPKCFSFNDGFALDETFARNTKLPESQNSYEFSDVGGSTKAVYTSVYATAEALDQVLQMGLEEGATTAINQIDEFLAR